MRFARRSVSDQDIKKYEMFSQTLQQSRGLVKTSDSQTRWQQQEDQGRPEDRHLQPPATSRTLVMTMIYTVRYELKPSHLIFASRTPFPSELKYPHASAATSFNTDDPFCLVEFFH